MVGERGEKTRILYFCPLFYWLSSIYKFVMSSVSICNNLFFSNIFQDYQTDPRGTIKLFLTGNISLWYLMRTSATFTFFAASANKFCKEKNQERNIQRSDLLSFWNPSAPRYQAREEPGRRGVRGCQCPSCCLPSPHGRGAAPPPPASPCWSPPACPARTDDHSIWIMEEKNIYIDLVGGSKKGQNVQNYRQTRFLVRH